MNHNDFVISKEGLEWVLQRITVDSEYCGPYPAIISRHKTFKEVIKKLEEISANWE